MSRTALVLPLFALGCADPVVISGTVGGFSLDEPAALYFGGPFVSFVNEPLTCMEMAYTARVYTEGQAPTEFDFAGVQFAFDDDAITEGVFSVEGDAAVHSKFLVVEGGAFTEYRARTGTLTIDTIEEDKLVEGSFDVAFGEDGSLSTTWFSAEWCLNMER